MLARPRIWADGNLAYQEAILVCHELLSTHALGDVLVVRGNTFAVDSTLFSSALSRLGYRCGLTYFRRALGDVASELLNGSRTSRHGDGYNEV